MTIEGGKVVLRDIEEEMKESYTSYAMSVIISRALPDARDGLKPSQRRILVAMNDLNLSPGAKHRKCAKIAGDTSGNYHPHGEQVIYPTLVRMAQQVDELHRIHGLQIDFPLFNSSTGRSAGDINQTHTVAGGAVTTQREP